MKGTKFFGLLVNTFMLLLLLSGCGWLSDNPMFPKAKIDMSITILAEDGSEVNVGVLGIISVSSLNNQSSVVYSDKVEETLTNVITVSVTQTVYEGIYPTVTQTTYQTINPNPQPFITQTTTTQVLDSSTQQQSVKFARVAKFTVHPINAVGGTIEECTIEYTDENGRIISALTRTLALSVQFLPVLPDNLAGSNLYNQTTSFTLEIFTTEVEDYFVNNGITSGQAIVTFQGTDSALHAISYKETIPITCPPYEIPSVSLTQSSTSPSSTSSTCQSCL